jgi:PAS domain S-box-containing protein
MRILVVDDHELVRRGICSVLETDPSLTICGEAVNGKDAVSKAGALHPDVVVMDISMPEMNGLEATREIKRLVPGAEIIIVSQHEAPQMVRQAFQAGARGYVVKSSISTDLLAAIARIAQGDRYLQVPGGASQAETPDSQEILQRNAAYERALRESEERFRSAMNNMAEGLYTIDAQGLVTYINPAAEAMFGWPSAELMGKKMHDVTHYKHPDGTPFPSAECAGLQVLQKGIELREHEDVFIRKDGAFFLVIFSSSPLKSDGKTVGVVVCFRDDTKRRKAEAALRQELEDATGKLRELSSRLLQTQDEERRRIARELHDGVGQLIVALNLNLSKVNSEKERLSPGARECLEENARLIDQASQEIRTMSHLLHPPLLDEVGLESALRWYGDGFAERSKIAVTMDLAPGFSEGLPRELSLSLFRIVQECLTNVHRHSGSATAFVRIRRSAGEISLEVKDEGKGIPAEIHSKISSGASAGVGLRGMRERIRQFGGRLEVASDRKGTRIIAVLPVPGLTDGQEALSFQPASAAIKSNGTANHHRDAATILLIDDEVAGLLPRKLLLESAGYQVIVARSGAEGIRIFEDNRIDAVILDYWMSGMKGTAVAEELKRINPGVPIVVLSGMSDLPGEASGIVDKWIVKGSTRAEQLLESVAALLDRRPV